MEMCVRCVIQDNKQLDIAGGAGYFSKELLSGINMMPCGRAVGFLCGRGRVLVG